TSSPASPGGWESPSESPCLRQRSSTDCRNWGRSICPSSGISSRKSSKSCRPSWSWTESDTDHKEERRMTEAQRLKLRNQLLEEKRRLEERLKKNRNFGLEQGMNDSIGELSGYDNHPGDIGTELYERGKDLALNEEDETRLKRINQALDRMERGEYGICAACGREIPVERLEAVPETAYCVEHEPER